MTDLIAERDALRDALSASRCQWIQSVNAERCLKALAISDETLPLAINKIPPTIEQYRRIVLCPRSPGKTTAAAILNLQLVAVEMRARKITSPTLTAWADRIDASLQVLAR